MSETITYVIGTVNPEAFDERGYNPATSIFAGMPTAQLQALLTAAQNAYTDISLGAKAVNISYAQGDGNKAVTYQMTSLPNVVAFIKQLQVQLGIVRHGRRPTRFRMR